MKTLHYHDKKPARIGDVFQAPRWGACVIVRFDHRNASAAVLNLMTGEEFGDLSQATFSEADILRRKPENITRRRMAREFEILRRKGGQP